MFPYRTDQEPQQGVDTGGASGILISSASLLRPGDILDRNLTQRFTQFGDKKCRPIASTG
jgi:hypothetical protein